MLFTVVLPAQDQENIGSRTVDRIKAVGGTGGGQGWNKLLNVDPPLMKNFTYEVDGRFIYETDNLGRVKKVTVENVQINRRPRNTDYQRRAKEVKDGKLNTPVDDGGHIIRAEWGGPSEQINYHSQNWAENSYGSWKQMEDAVTALREQNPNATIKFEVEAIFPENSKRPNRFLVNVYVNGNKNQSLSKPYLNPW